MQNPPPRKAPLQSAFDKHSTQDDRAVSQMGVVPPHCALDVHAAEPEQVFVRVSQKPAPPQSALVRHGCPLAHCASPAQGKATQLLVALQWGSRVPAQLVSDRHSTHTLVAGLQ